MKRLRIVLGLAAVTTAAVALIGFLNSSWFDVNAITVAGFSNADPDRVIEASGIELDQQLLDVDLDAAVESVEQVPWVDTAEIDRGWTGEILITIVERTPIAALPTGPRFALVDEQGRQLTVVADQPDGLLPIAGVEASGVAGESAPAEAAAVLSVSRALTPELRLQIVGLQVSDASVLADLKIGGQVNFGGADQLGQKMQALDTMLSQVDLTCVAMIDVRVPSAPTLVRQPGSSEPSTAESGVDDSSSTQSDPIEEPEQTAGDC